MSKKKSFYQIAWDSTAGSSYYDTTTNTSSTMSTGSLTAQDIDTAWRSYIDYAYDHFYRSSGRSKNLIVPSDTERVTVPKANLEIQLPDGHRVVVDVRGNFQIEDKDAKVTYRANTNREFNPFVNAGDLTARFIEYVRKLHPAITQKEIATLPLQLFVHWLIVEAAEKDRDPLPEGVERIPESRMLRAGIHPQCKLPTCRRFIARTQKDFGYCNVEHAGKHHKLLAA